MRELFLLQAGGQQYGVWKDEIVSVKDVQTLHRLPLAPACIAGMSIIDDRTVTLADLPVCIGHAPAAGNGQGRVLILSGAEKTMGFMVSGDIGTLSIPDDAVFPVPEYVRTVVINSCAIHNSIPIPIINVSALYHQLLKPDQDLPRAAFIIPDAGSQNNSKRSAVRLMDLGGQLYAAPSKGREEQTTEAAAASGLSRVPQYVKGIGFCNGSVLTVIDMPQRIKRQKSKPGARMILEQIAGEKFGLLVDEDRGTVPAASVIIADLPPIAHCSWLNAALLHGGQIVPLVELPALLSADLKDAAQKPLPKRYAPDSAFHELFKRQDVDVVEFLLLGAPHALPKCEVEDIFPLRSYRDIPETPEIVVGVAEHKGSLLPVLDLAMVFGRRSIVTPEWRMMLVKNGDFRALVITEAVFGERRLPLDVQRAVPIVLPHRVVYGCYPDPDSVRLILNVEAMAVHFEKSLVRELLPALSLEMKRAPAAIVHALLDEETDAAVPIGNEASPLSDKEQLIGSPGATELSTGKEIIETAQSDRFSEPENGIKPEETHETPGEIKEESQEEIPAQIGEQEYRDVTFVSEQRREPAFEPEAASLPGGMPIDGAAVKLEGGLEEHQESVGSSKGEVAVPAGIASLHEERAEEEEPAPISPVLENAKAESHDQAELGTAAGETFEEQAQETISFSAGEELKPVVLDEAFEPAQAPLEVTATPSPAIGLQTFDEEAEPEEERSFATADKRISYNGHEEQVDQSASSASEFASSEQSWKRRLSYSAIGALLIAILYFMGIFEKSGIENQAKQATPAPAKTVSTEEPRRTPEKSEPPLVLEIPESRPTHIDVYVVIQGDTLWSISERFTGNPFNYPRIAGENRIANPDLIFPGQKIRLKKGNNEQTTNSM